jgi:hypothetical protein
MRMRGGLSKSSQYLGRLQGERGVLEAIQFVNKGFEAKTAQLALPL